MCENGGRQGILEKFEIAIDLYNHKLEFVLENKNMKFYGKSSHRETKDVKA